MFAKGSIFLGNLGYRFLWNMPRKVDFDAKAKEIRAILDKHSGMPSQKDDKRAYSNIKYYMQKHGEDPRIRAIIDDYGLRVPSKVDLDEKVKELGACLERHSGMPSQRKNSVAYASVRYYVRKYGEDPRIRDLVSKYGIMIRSKDRSYFESDLKEVEEALGRLGRMPTFKEDKGLHCRIRYFFKKYADRPEIDRLRYVYAPHGLYPYAATAPGKPRRDHYATYIRDVFSRFYELPARNTAPMVDLRNAINSWLKTREPDETLASLVRCLAELGCRNGRILEVKAALDRAR